MNCREHRLPELELATNQVREALQCLLHTILFLRAPGPVVPQEVHCEGFDLTYTRIAESKNNAFDGILNSGSRSDAGVNVEAGVDVGGGNGGMKLLSSKKNSKNEPMPHTNPPSKFEGKNNITNSLTNSRNIDKKVNDSIEEFLRSLSHVGPELLQGCLTVSFFERRATQKLFWSQEEKIVWEQWVVPVLVNNTPRPVNDDTASVIERQRIQETAEGMLKETLFKVFDEVGGDNVEHIPPVMYEFQINCMKRGEERENMYAIVSNMPAMISLS